MTRPFAVVSRAAHANNVSHLTAKRLDEDAALNKAQSIEALISAARSLGMSPALIEAMTSEKEDYALLHMTTLERERLRNVLFRQDLGYSGAYIAKDGINFTHGATISQVADPIQAFHTVLNAVENLEFNGKIVLHYLDNDEEVVLNVEKSQISVSANV